MNIKQIVISLSELYKNATDGLWDQNVMVRDYSISDRWYPLNGFNTPDEMINMFRKGYSYLFLGNKTKEIEELHNDGEPFIIVVAGPSGDTIWCVINGEDVGF